MSVEKRQTAIGRRPWEPPAFNASGALTGDAGLGWPVVCIAAPTRLRGSYPKSGQPVADAVVTHA